MGVDGPYPHIAFEEGERFREKELLQLAKAFAAEMRNQENTYAMKGGTALRFTLGLPRPSMDLDFEGEKPIWLRWTVKKAIKTAFPGERYRVGFDLTRVGTIPIRPPRKRAGTTPNLGIDYRETGSMNDMPECIPLEACTQHEGIQIYKPDALVHRKLATLIGPSPREKARDIYDAGWLVTERPALIGKEDRGTLQAWLAAKSHEEVGSLKEKLKEDAITGRVDADDIWKRLTNGIRRLDLAERRHGGKQRGTTMEGRSGTTGDAEKRQYGVRETTRAAMAKHANPMRLTHEQDDPSPKQKPLAKLTKEREESGPQRGPEH